MISGLLMSAGVDILGSLFESGTETVKEKAVDFVKEKTGINLKTSSKLSSDDINKLKKLEAENAAELSKLLIEDRKSAREMNIKIQSSKDWLVRNTGSMIGLFVVLSAFFMDMYLLYLIDSGKEVNPIYTLIQGGVNVRAVQVLSFYFGDSKASADTSRKP